MGTTLPTKSDFDPFGGGLDEQVAWKHFGGLELAEAHKRFCENPLCYQEDFMWMGHVALAYYFPVLDKYLRAGDDEELSRIIASGLIIQFGYDDISAIEHIKPQVIELADFVIQNISIGDHDLLRQLKGNLGNAG